MPSTDFDDGVVAVGDTLDDRESESAAARDVAGGGAAVEAIEYARALGFSGYRGRVSRTASCGLPCSFVTTTSTRPSTGVYRSALSTRLEISVARRRHRPGRIQASQL